MTTLKNIRNAMILIPTLTVSGCYQGLDPYGNPGLFTPTPIFLRNLPRGDDSFSRGFRDGCYNFVGQAGYGMNRMHDRAPNLAFLKDENMYWDGYSNGDRHCSVYVNKDITL